MAHELERSRLRVVGAPVLCEPAEANRRAGLALALRGLQLAGEQAQQHRFAGAVLPDDADPFAAQHGQVDAGHDRPASELDADTGKLDHAFAAARVRPQIERDLAPLEHRAVDLLHPIDLPLLVARPNDVPFVDDPRRPVLETADRLLEPGDLLLLGHVGLLLALELELARDRVGGVVARPHPDAPAVQLRDLGHGLVEQIAIVRDRDDRAVERAHQTLDAFARLDVEMRLRLVEEQHVGLPEETRCEADQLPLASREDARRLGEIVVLEPDVDQERAGAGLEPGAARRGPAIEQLLLPAQQP